MTKHRNAAEDLVELRTWLQASGEQYHLVADLRAGVAEMDDSEFEISVGITRATLIVQMDGLDFSPGLRFGETLAGPSVLVTETTEEHQKRGGSAKANLAANLSGIIKGGLSASALAEASQTTTRIATSHEQHVPVRAEPGGRWTITEPHGKVLSNTFLAGSTLCKMTPIRAANRCASTTTLVVKQKDLDLTLRGSRLEKLTTPKKRLAAIVLAKAINASALPYAGQVTLCVSETEAEEVDSES